jgi:transposase
MTREEAIAIAHSDPEVIVDILLRMSQTIDELRSKIEELERNIAVLTRDSSNSSKPPSSDGPGAKPKARPAMKSKKRNPGGQPGHRGASRDLIPTEQVNGVIPVLPESCDHCGAVLTPDPDQPTGKCWRHQVIDIAEPKPEVAEYHLHCIRPAVNHQKNLHP